MDEGVTGRDDAERTAKIKSMVLKEMLKQGYANATREPFVGASRATPKPSFEECVAKVQRGEEVIIIYEDNDQIAIYDPAGEWQYSMEKVTGLDEPAVTTTAIMGRPLNGFKFPCVSPENVMDEAYVDGDGVNCVVRQICAKYDLGRCDVEADFDQISETIQPDREEGITTVQILEWCKRHIVNG